MIHDMLTALLLGVAYVLAAVKAVCWVQLVAVGCAIARRSAVLERVERAIVNVRVEDVWLTENSMGS